LSIQRKRRILEYIRKDTVYDYYNIFFDAIINAHKTYIIDGELGLMFVPERLVPPSRQNIEHTSKRKGLMHSMKSGIAIILSILLISSLCACSNTVNNSSNAINNSSNVINSDSDVVNSDSDVVNRGSDAVNNSNYTIQGQYYISDKDKLESDLDSDNIINFIRDYLDEEIEFVGVDKGIELNNECKNTYTFKLINRENTPTFKVIASYLKHEEWLNEDDNSRYNLSFTTDYGKVISNEYSNKRKELASKYNIDEKEIVDNNQKREWFISKNEGNNIYEDEIDYYINNSEIHIIHIDNKDNIEDIKEYLREINSLYNISFRCYGYETEYRHGDSKVNGYKPIKEEEAVPFTYLISDDYSNITLVYYNDTLEYDVINYYDNDIIDELGTESLDGKGIIFQ